MDINSPLKRTKITSLGIENNCYNRNTMEMFHVVQNTNSVILRADTESLSVIYHDAIETCGYFQNLTNALTTHTCYSF